MFKILIQNTQKIDAYKNYNIVIWKLCNSEQFQV